MSCLSVLPQAILNPYHADRKRSLHERPNGLDKGGSLWMASNI
jgi:hypothetical protein